MKKRALAPVALVALVAAAGCGKGPPSSAGATVAVDAEARPGFAAKVALHAAEARSTRGISRLWRFAIASGGLVAATAALVIAILPHPSHHRRVRR